MHKDLKLIETRGLQSLKLESCRAYESLFWKQIRKKALSEKNDENQI